MSTNRTPINPELLAILRDPYAIQLGDQLGPNAGVLTPVGDYWLVSADTGYKYPIRDGVPVMLVSEGARWKDTAVADLPVPPPPQLDPDASPALPPPTERGNVAIAPGNDTTNLVVLAVAGSFLVLAGLIGLSRLRRRG